MLNDIELIAVLSNGRVLPATCCKYGACVCILCIISCSRYFINININHVWVIQCGTVLYLRYIYLILYTFK